MHTAFLECFRLPSLGGASPVTQTATDGRNAGGLERLEVQVETCWQIAEWPTLAAKHKVTFTCIKAHSCLRSVRYSITQIYSYASFSFLQERSHPPGV